MTHTLSSPVSRRTQRGFSLLELSIALAVIGIVVAGGLTMSTSMVDRTAYVQTGNQMDEVDKAVAAFVAVTNRLPCPADPALVLGDANFGREQSNCNAATAGGVVETAGTGGSKVLIGALPVRTLGLRDRMAADEYGNRYTYAVTSALTTSNETGGYRDGAVAGAITLADTGIDDSAYVVVSHGGDAKGAYRYETANNTVSCAGGMDAENCNNDAVFRDTRFNRGSVAGNWFDDTVRFKRKEMINLIAGGAASGGNQFWAADGNHIYNTNSGNVGVGGAAMGARLAVHSTDTQDVLHLSGRNGSANVLDIDSAIGENGIRLVTKGTTRSMLIDNVGTGTGIDLTMNNEATGINVRLLGGGIGINVLSETGGDGIQADVWGSDGNQYAVSGFTNGGSGGTFDASAGVRGVVRNSPGWGVYGLHAVAYGEGMGVYGVTESDSGFGVYGRAVAGTGVNYGGYFTNVSTTANASAVRGETSGATGTTYGVYGSVVSTTAGASGVHGRANANSGHTRGVFGSAISGIGVYGTTTSADINNKHAGVYGYSSANNTFGIGVFGEGSMGVRGNSNFVQGFGLYGQAAANLGTGVQGYATAASTQTRGVLGQSDSSAGIGVQGNASSTSGNTYGVYGTANSPSGHGVSGYNSSTTGAAYAVFGYNYSTSGAAIRGEARGTSGTNHGIYGHSASPNGYGVYCAGTLCGGTVAWTPASDVRLKENVVNLHDDHGLDAIRKLRPVTYTWKDTQKHSLGTQIGFIAQEVEAIMPELVVQGSDLEITHKDGKKEMVKNTKAMAYETLTAPLVRAVQQLADRLDVLWGNVKKLFERVDAQDAKIKALEDENKALKDRLDALEAKIMN